MTDERLDPGIADLASLYLPSYLTWEQREELRDNLRAFPRITNFYLPDSPSLPEVLQGDVWNGFVALSFRSSERRIVEGILLSNTCDVAVENEHRTQPKMVFAPVLSVAKYEVVLRGAGIPEEQIADILRSIRQQFTTNVFYLPPATYGMETEAMVVLDDVHSQPLDAFLHSERRLTSRLSQSGFYIFLIKLSIHFCRFLEGVARFPDSPPDGEGLPA